MEGHTLTNLQRLRCVRLLLSLFIVALVLSGLTAFPLVWELRVLTSWFGEGTTIGAAIPGLAHWLTYVREGLETTGREYPFLAYGTDWLAFAHIVIAIAFVGPLVNPVKNIWVVEFGMIACVLVIPLGVDLRPHSRHPLWLAAYRLLLRCFWLGSAGNRLANDSRNRPGRTTLELCLSKVASVHQCIKNQLRDDQIRIPPFVTPKELDGHVRIAYKRAQDPCHLNRNEDVKQQP